MTSERPARTWSFFWYLAVVVFAVVVLNAYGWFPAFNAAIPFVAGILWVTVLALAAWGAGRLVAGRWFGSDPLALDAVVLLLLAGTATLAATSGLLAVLRLLRPTLVLGALGIWACVGAISLYRRRPFSSLSNLTASRLWFLVIVLAGGTSLAAATTFAPFYDQWHYHLGFPYHWLREGTVVSFPRHAYSFFPANMGLLYTYALAGPGGWAAQVIHWWMGVLTAAGSAAVAYRLGAPVSGRTLAAAVFLATPATVQMGALAGSDLGVAAFAVGGVLAVLRMISNPEHARTMATAAGLAAGFAAGCKYTALSIVLPPLGMVAVAVTAAVSARDRRWRQVVTVALAFSLSAGVILAPWFIRNAAATGNPVYPYLAQVFSNEHRTGQGTDDTVASGIGSFGLTSSKVTAALTLGTFSRRGQAGDIGPIYLLSVPLILMWAWHNRSRTEVWAVIGLVVIAIPAWAVGPPLGRYLLPILAVCAGLIGASWSDLSVRCSRGIRIASATLFFVILVANCNPIRGEYLLDQIRCFLGAEISENYLEANSSQIEVFRAANASLPPDAKVLLVGEPRPFGIDRDVVVEDQFRPPLLVELANRSSTPGEIADGLHKLGVTHLVWNATEAARIAEAEGRQRYLECDGDPSQDRLDRFLSEFTHPIEAGEWWEITELSPR